LKAVIYTELMQAVVLIGGAVMLTVLGMNEVGGWAGLREALPVDYFSMFKPSSHADFPWTGILFGAPILGIWYWCTDQFIVQRVLAAKNINHARSGAIFAGFLKILPVFILVLPGLVAAVLFPGIEGDEAYPMLVTSHLLPIGIKGIVIAALLAALMSSLASVFNSSSTLFTMDFYKNIKPSASENELVLVGRLATTVLVILGILWVPLIRSVSSQLFVYLQSVQGYISPPIAAVFLFGIFWKRANGRGAIYALVGGGILGAARLIMEILTKRSGLDFGILDWYATMNFLHFATMLFVISAAILLLVSLLSEAPARVKIAGLTFTTADEIQSDYIRKIEERNPRWTQINIGLSILLVMSILTLWGIFF